MADSAQGIGSASIDGQAHGDMQPKTYATDISAAQAQHKPSEKNPTPKETVESEGNASKLTQSPLMAAAASGNLEKVKELLANGHEAAEQDDHSGTSVLMAAAIGGHTEVVNALLLAGAPWNAIDRKLRCAGDLALEHDQMDAARALLEAGVRAELVLGAAQRAGASATAGPSNNAFLQQRLTYDGTKLLDENSLGVMMAWEGPLMRAHAQAVAESQGDVLNVGFGMGLVDRAIQALKPRSHTIVEAHPDVYARMLSEGWGDKPGVTILFGRWQDVLPKLDRKFNGIMTDTFGEYYDDLRDFHHLLPKLLAPGGFYTFFNGLAADNAFFHSVCCRVVSAELERQGLTTTFVPLGIDVANRKVWEGVALRYWQLDVYFLPVCEWTADVPQPASTKNQAVTTSTQDDQSEANTAAGADPDGSK